MQTKHRKKKDAGDVPDRPSQRPEVYGSRKGLEDIARGRGIEQREGVGERGGRTREQVRWCRAGEFKAP